MPSKHILYSDKYYDDEFEYRHVQVPSDVAKCVPKGRLMTEDEWRSIGIQQSRGWIHYMIHEPEPHILLFRRPISGTPPTQEEQFQMEQEQYKAQEEEHEKLQKEELKIQEGAMCR